MNETLEKWHEIKTLIDSLEIDVHKSAVKGVTVAGIRARKGLRLVRNKTKELVVLLLNADKQRREEKKQAKSS